MSPASHAAPQCGGPGAGRVGIHLSNRGSKSVAGQAVTVSYTAQGTPIQDSAGNDAANLSARSVSNPEKAPEVVSAEVNGVTLTITFDEALSTDPAHRTNGSRFRLKVNGTLTQLTELGSERTRAC